MAPTISVKSCDCFWNAGNQGVYFYLHFTGLMGEVGLITCKYVIRLTILHESEYKMKMYFW